MRQAANRAKIYARQQHERPCAGEQDGVATHPAGDVKPGSRAPGGSSPTCLAIKQQRERHPETVTLSLFPTTQSRRRETK